MPDDPHADLRRHVLDALDEKGAHLSFGAVTDGWPPASRGAKPQGAPHTAWQLVEHLRLAQRDILDFTVSATYEERPFPEGYWPSSEAPADDAAWSESLAGFRRDLERMKAFVADPATNLFEVIERGTGQTILREALLIADHNAYHVGQLALLRRLVGQWHDPRLES